MIKREINLGVLTQQWQRNAEVTVNNWKNKKYIFVTIIGVFLHGLSQMDLSQIHPLKRYVIVSLFICSIISTLCCAGSESAIIIRNTKYLRQGCETRPNARLYQLLSIQLCATFENVLMINVIVSLGPNIGRVIGAGRTYTFNIDMSTSHYGSTCDCQRIIPTHT